MAKITKDALIEARQAIMDIDAALEAEGAKYKHGATATEAVEYDLRIARLQAARNQASDAYQNALSRVADALAKADAEAVADSE